MFLNKRQKNTMDGICRTCMTSDKPVRSLFEIDTDFIELHVKLYTCFPTFNLDDSDFPTAMCDVCIKMLQNAYKFRELCVKSTCTFLQKRNSKKSKNCETETVSTNTETNTDNEQNLVISTSDVGTSTDHFDNILATPINKLSKKSSETTVDSSSSDLTENTETSINSISLENVDISNIDSNANKKCIKVYPLNSAQISKNTQNENEINSKICNNEVQTSSPPSPVLINQSQSSEDLNESVEKITDNLYILNDYILLSGKTLDKNEIVEKESLEHVETETNKDINLSLATQTQTQSSPESESEHENTNTNNFVCSIPIENLNENIQKELNEKTQNNILPEDDGLSSESDDESLLKPLENYTQNNFIKSALAYLDEDIENGDSFEDFQDEIEVTAQPSEDSSMNIIDSQETENESSISLFETSSLQEFHISDIVSLNEECKKEVEEEEPEIKPIITPIPLSKLLSTTQCPQPSADEVDDLVSKNVTEVFDYKNHNDHNYAKIHYESVEDKSQLQELDNKRKRRFSGRIVSQQAAKSTPSVTENAEAKPDTSPEQPFIKKLRSQTKNTNVEEGEIIQMPKLVPIQKPNALKPPQLDIVKRGASVYDFIDELCETPIQRTLPKLREKPSFYKSAEKTAIDTNDTNIVRKRVFRKRNAKVVDGPVVKKNSPRLVRKEEQPNVKENIPKTKDETISKVQEEESLINKDNILEEPIPKKDNQNIAGESVSNTSKVSVNTELTNMNSSENVEQFKLKKNVLNIKIKKKKLQIPGSKKKKMQIPTVKKKMIKEYKITRQYKSKLKEIDKNESSEDKNENEKTKEVTPIKITITKIEASPKETKIATSPAGDVTATNINEVSNDMDLEYPFECDLCGMRKSSISDLKEHLFLHTEDRMMCKYCGKTFKTQTGCNRHVGMVHKKESKAELSTSKYEISPTKSEISTTKSDISTTESDITASPDSKYSHLCTVCDKVLPTRNSLLQHKKIHNTDQ